MALTLEDLTKPVSEEDPCGEDVEYDPLFAAMETMIEAKPDQEFGDTVIAGEGPDWQGVRDNAFALLERSRDLRAMTYGAIASMHTDGLPQFAIMMQGIQGCIDMYWENIHPELDPDDDYDPTMRMNALQMLNERSSVPNGVDHAVLVELRGIGQFSQHSIDLAEGRVQPVGDEVVPEVLAIRDAFAQAEPEYLETLRKSVTDSLEAFSEIERIWDEKVGDAASLELSLATGSLQHLQKTLHEFAPGEEDLPEGMDEEGAGAGAVAGGQQPSVSGAVNSREDVIRVLTKVCQYYEKNEPSSPIPLLLERAQRLVAKSFFEILNDIVPESVPQARIVSGTQEEETY
jgi:type VI secretion system protein ImpA